LSSATRGRRGVRARQAARAFSTSARLSRPGRWEGTGGAALAVWAEHAERQMGGDAAVDEALRAALATTEERWGRITAHFLGQMLVVLIEHWYYGRELQERLTPIERRLMEDSLLLKIGELQESAAVRNEQL